MNPLQVGKNPGALRCRRKFLRIFPGGFDDETYLSWERGYKWTAHEGWDELLNLKEYRSLLRRKQFGEIAARAVRLESRTNLLFSFEKMAIHDAVRSTECARQFAEGLYDFIYASGDHAKKFDRWCQIVSGLPRKQTRVLTWPVVTVFAFIALPGEHIFLKPNVTRVAAKEYGYEFEYRSRPEWTTYANFQDFARLVRRDLRDLRPRDMIDIQSFLWLQGSDEYD